MRDYPETNFIETKNNIVERVLFRFASLPATFHMFYLCSRSPAKTLCAYSEYSAPKPGSPIRKQVVFLTKKNNCKAAEMSGKTKKDQLKKFITINN